jgi:hypothetical protein
MPRANAAASTGAVFGTRGLGGPRSSSAAVPAAAHEIRPPVVVPVAEVDVVAVVWAWEWAVGRS